MFDKTKFWFKKFSCKEAKNLKLTAKLYLAFEYFGVDHNTFDRNAFLCYKFQDGRTLVADLARQTADGAAQDLIVILQWLKRKKNKQIH